MLESRMCSKHRVVRLNDRRRQLRGGVDAKLELRLFTIVGRQSLEKKCAETRSSTTTERVEDKEALEATAVVRKPTDLVHGRVDKLLPNRVVAACIYKRIHPN
jgi:hypothetical protein